MAQDLQALVGSDYLSSADLDAAGTKALLRLAAGIKGVTACVPRRRDGCWG